MLDFSIEFRPLISEDASFEMIFGEPIIFLGILDKVLGGLWVLLSEQIEVDLQDVGIGEGYSGDELIEESLVVLDFHLAHNYTNYKYQFCKHSRRLNSHSSYLNRSPLYLFIISTFS